MAALDQLCLATHWTLRAGLNGDPGVQFVSPAQGPVPLPLPGGQRRAYLANHGAGIGR